jgi:predicted membrane protein
MNKNFFAGMEEVFSRLISTFLTIVFFLVYISAKDSRELVLNWSGMLAVLLIFWIVYELVAYCLYVLFIYFSKQSQVNSISDLPEKPEMVNLGNDENEKM